MHKILNAWTRTLGLVVLLLAVMLLGGCDDEENNAKQQKFTNAYNAEDTWLVYWYVCGTDLETRFGAATTDISELMDVELPPNVKVLIQTGGTADWKNSTMPNRKIGRFLYDKDGLHELEQLPDADMGSPRTLSDFLRYGKDNFEADHRVFVFWDHGGGSAAGVCVDEHTKNALSLNDIRNAFTSVHTASPEQPPFELIGFDACLMATYDVANTLHGLARYMTASEELEPGNGWYYTGWVGALAKNPAMGGAALGQAICDSYMKGCKEEGTEDSATLSVIDLSKVPALRTAYESFGVEALRHAVDNPRSFFSSFSREAQQAENYGGNTRDQGYSNMVDLGDLAHEASVLLPETSQNLIRAIDDAVIYKVHGVYRDRGSGISGFYSYDGSVESLNSYAAQEAAPLSLKCLFHYLIHGQLPQEAKTLLEGGTPGGTATTLAPAAPAQMQKIFNVASLEDWPVNIDKDGNAFITLSQEQMDMLSGIHCQLLIMSVERDIILHLGTDGDIDADWDKGVFKDNFRNVWPMLDGHPVFIEITAEEDDYNLYSVPIKLNGEECNLQVSYSFKDEKYYILGARKGIDSQGMGDRNLIKLKKGDQITTIHYVTTISGNESGLTAVDVETFTIGDHPKFADENLGDSEYAYFFEFVTPTGETALSKLVQFSVRNGDIFTSVDI